MICVENLSAGYARKMVIKNISIDIMPGQILVLAGPNGSGKSTFLKAIMGFLKDYSGNITYDGVAMETLRGKELAKKATYLSQSRNVSSISAMRMVLHGRFPYLSYPRKYRKKDYEIAKRAMELTGSHEYADRMVAELSGGERQSVYLAMALAQETDYIFMDEPMTYLDINRQLQLVQNAKMMANAGKAVVMVLHDISQALQIADRIAVIENGELIAVDTPDQMCKSKVLDDVFQVMVCQTETVHGTHYYCVPKREE